MSDEAEMLELIADSADARPSFLRIADEILSILPSAEIEHVGATAVAGCLTKGDIDVLVRVSPQTFFEATQALDAVLRRSGRNDSTSDYVEYEYDGDGRPASIQLVVAGCWHDRRFRQLKRALGSDGSALARYNSLKLSCEGHSMAEYRAAKSAFIDSVLAEAEGAGVGKDSPVAPGIRE